VEGLRRGERVEKGRRGKGKGKEEGKGEGREREGPPGTCLHPPDMKS